MKQPSHNNCLVCSTWNAVLRIGSFWGQVVAVRNPQADLGWNREYKLIYYFFSWGFWSPAPELGQGLPDHRGTGARPPPRSCSFQEGRSILEPQGQARSCIDDCPLLLCPSSRTILLRGISWAWVYPVSCERAQLLGKTQCRAALEGSKGLLKP